MSWLSSALLDVFAPGHSSVYGSGKWHHALPATSSHLLSSASAPCSALMGALSCDSGTSSHREVIVIHSKFKKRGIFYLRLYHYRSRFLFATPTKTDVFPQKKKNMFFIFIFYLKNFFRFLSKHFPAHILMKESSTSGGGAGISKVPSRGSPRGSMTGLGKFDMSRAELSWTKWLDLALRPWLSKNLPNIFYPLLKIENALTVG